MANKGRAAAVTTDAEQVLLDVGGQRADHRLGPRHDGGHRRLGQPERDHRGGLVGDERRGHPDQHADGLGLLGDDVARGHLERIGQHRAPGRELIDVAGCQGSPARLHDLGRHRLVGPGDGRDRLGGVLVGRGDGSPELSDQPRELGDRVLVQVRPGHADHVEEVHYRERQVVDRHAL